jgi:hypothetical protein
MVMFMISKIILIVLGRFIKNRVIDLGYLLLNVGNNMNLTKKQLNILYQIILNEMERVDRKTPVGYVETLQELELIISNLIDKQ